MLVPNARMLLLAQTRTVWRAELLAFLLRGGGAGGNHELVGSLFPGNGSEDQGFVFEDVCGHAAGFAAAWR